VRTQSVLGSVLRAYLGAYSQTGWECASCAIGTVPSSAIGSVLGSMPGSVLENVLGGVLGCVLGVYLGAS
jgi:hypothetical protein